MGAKRRIVCESGACAQARDLANDDRISYADYRRGLCCGHRREDDQRQRRLSKARALIQKAAPELLETLEACLAAMDCELDDYDKWIGRGPGGKYRDARNAARALVKKAVPDA